MRNKHAIPVKPRGRHPHQRLTAIAVRATRAPGRYADGNGLYLIVDPSGAKLWVWRGVVQSKRCDLGLGGIDLVPLVEARAAALQCRRTARAGGNPKIDRVQAKRLALTFKHASLHAEHSKIFRNAKHAADWLSSLERDAFPLIGTRPVNQVDSSDVLRVLTPIWTKKPETARRLKQRIKKLVLDRAKAEKLRTGDNPVDDLKLVLPKHKDRPDHHAALPYPAVASFISSLHAIPTCAPQFVSPLNC